MRYVQVVDPGKLATGRRKWKRGLRRQRNFKYCDVPPRDGDDAGTHDLVSGWQLSCSLPQTKADPRFGCCEQGNQVSEVRSPSADGTA
jgi:hypothetical protein